MELSIDEIDQVTKSMEQESKAIKDELFRMCWYMRGGLSFSESYDLTLDDREVIAKIVDDNLTLTKESKLPFF